MNLYQLKKLKNLKYVYTFKQVCLQFQLYLQYNVSYVCYFNPQEWNMQILNFPRGTSNAGGAAAGAAATFFIYRIELAHRIASPPVYYKNMN